MLGLGVGHGIEPPDSHNLADRLSAAIVRIGIGTEHAAQVRLKPKLLGGWLLIAALINAVGLDGTGNGNMYAHVKSREGIVAAVE